MTVAAGPSAAQRLAIGARGGTLGIGAEAIAGLSDRVNVRIGVNRFSYSRRDDESAFELSTPVAFLMRSDANVSNVTGMVDFMPFRSFLRLSAGAMLNNTEGTSLVELTEPYTVAEKTLSPERIGTLTATLDWTRKVAPYIGFGFGNAAKATGRLAVNFDLGAFYTGAPRLNMVGTRLVAPTADQDQKIEDALREFKWYPNLSLGLSYRIK